MKPLGHEFGLCDSLMGILSCNLFLILKHITLNQMPVRKLFTFDCLFVSALLHLNPSFLVLLHLLDLEHWNAELVLFTKSQQVFALLLLHLEFEFPVLVLLLFHLVAELLEGI